MFRLSLLATSLLLTAIAVAVAESQDVGHRVKVHGMHMYYEISGAGDPIVVSGGAMDDMGKPLPAPRLAILPATAHTAVITHVDPLSAIIEPFLKGGTPKGMFQAGSR